MQTFALVFIVPAMALQQPQPTTAPSKDLTLISSTKCLENGSPDKYCCAYPSEASCADGYAYSAGDSCGFLGRWSKTLCAPPVELQLRAATVPPSTPTSATTPSPTSRAGGTWTAPIVGGISGNQCENGDLGTGHTIEWCQAYCENHPECKSIQFKPTDGACWLKDCEIGDGVCANNNDQAMRYSSWEEDTDETSTPPPTPCDNSSGICTISEDPHIEIFDGSQISLLQRRTVVNSSSDDWAGDRWLVRTDLISIQARYVEEGNNHSLERFFYVRAVAVGGAFLQGNKIAIGSLEDQITWNGEAILQEQESTFSAAFGKFFMKARRSRNSSLVQDLSTTNPGVNIELPLGVSLIVNRLHDHVNTAIKMPRQQGGQDGLCGNFNGFAADDTLELAAQRRDPKVTPAESLFNGLY